MGGGDSGKSSDSGDSTLTLSVEKMKLMVGDWSTVHMLPRGHLQFKMMPVRVCSRDFPGREFPGNHGFSRENSREQKTNGISREFPGKFPGFCSFSCFPFPGK